MVRSVGVVSRQHYRAAGRRVQVEGIVAVPFLGGLMRWPFVTSALALVSAIAPAQIATPAKTPGPVLLALGPARGRGGAGLHLRAEYYLTQRERLVSLRAEVGGRWTPTQAFLDVTVGLAAILTPLPTATFSPYLVTGIVAVQSWSRGKPDGSLVSPASQHVSAIGADFTGGVLGVGLRARLGNRVFQLEARHLETTRALTLGMALPF